MAVLLFAKRQRFHLSVCLLSLSSIPSVCHHHCFDVHRCLSYRTPGNRQDRKKVPQKGHAHHHPGAHDFVTALRLRGGRRPQRRHQPLFVDISFWRRFLDILVSAGRRQLHVPGVTCRKLLHGNAFSTAEAGILLAHDHRGRRPAGCRQHSREYRWLLR